MNAYPKDLRLRVLAAVGREICPGRKAIETFSASLVTIKRRLKRRREMGGVQTEPILGRTSVNLTFRTYKRLHSELLVAACTLSLRLEG